MIWSPTNLIIINYNLQKYEDNLHYFGLEGLTLTFFPTSLSDFSPTSLLKLLNPNNLKHNATNLNHNLEYNIAPLEILLPWQHAMIKSMLSWGSLKNV
jgi:hypothetical protein